MAEIASRELRNDTAGVLRRVEAGESLIVTANGRPVAELVPLPRTRRSWLPRLNSSAACDTPRPTLGCGTTSESWRATRPTISVRFGE